MVLGLATDQLHEAVVLLVLVGQVADLADLLLALAALLVLQPPLLLLALLLQLPRAQLLFAGRLLGRRTWERGTVVSWGYVRPVGPNVGNHLINGTRREVR